MGQAHPVIRGGFSASRIFAQLTSLPPPHNGETWPVSDHKVKSNHIEMSISGGDKLNERKTRKLATTNRLHFSVRVTKMFGQGRGMFNSVKNYPVI